MVPGDGVELACVRCRKVAEERTQKESMPKGEPTRDKEPSHKSNSRQRAMTAAESKNNQTARLSPRRPGMVFFQVFTAIWSLTLRSPPFVCLPASLSSSTRINIRPLLPQAYPSLQPPSTNSAVVKRSSSSSSSHRFFLPLTHSFPDSHSSGKCRPRRIEEKWGSRRKEEEGGGEGNEIKPLMPSSLPPP